MSHTYEEVLEVRHWTDTLFSLRTTRDPSFRFQCGQFTMIGLPINGRPLMRAYSLVSAAYDEVLEFLSIKVQDGPFTQHLQHIESGEKLIVGKKATGTLVLGNLLPGRNLYLLGTGTGLAPFMSIIRDPETYERFERVILVHGCRKVDELAYYETITKTLPDDEFLGEEIRTKLTYYPTVTREPFRNRGRITDLIASSAFFDEIGTKSLDSECDRLMLCGSPAMVKDLHEFLAGSAFAEGSVSRPGHYVVERAFVER
jgi:ferredoxin--NADP+ reductase